MGFLRICIGDVSVRAELDSSDVARQVSGMLPLSGNAALWGEEIYFGIPLVSSSTELVDEVAAGDIAYWPPGHALCMFWGRTPRSLGNEIRPASPVVVFGHIVGDARVLANCVDGDSVRVEWLEDGQE